MNAADFQLDLMPDQPIPVMVKAIFEALTEVDPGMGNPPAFLWELYSPHGVAVVLAARLARAGWSVNHD